ncbi:hypothetical protein [Roseomonas indoligenes]|uniref:Uncharacterized protein n=1 Tax=Roseomonas indoligenes TaxID=2820811 RepID=A0A940MYU2_9PROT|nr:hypothetical protein [Pararoseomonas indoligenes]MBP0494661.1 hypothetical protein [Pararoseomonas indoligenes]
MLTPRLNAGILGLALTGLYVLPVAAQSWPSDSGPTSDYLGLTVRQFERLSPPPIERNLGERVVPDMPVTDVPGSVEVGTPSIVAAPLPPSTSRSRSYRDEPRRTERRRANIRSTAASRSVSRSGAVTWDELRRELSDRDQQIRDLQRQLDQERRSPR